MRPFTARHFHRVTHFDDVELVCIKCFACEYVEAGGLMSYGPNLAESRRQIGVYAGRMEELADIISQEVGAPLWLAQAAQAAAGFAHIAIGAFASFLKYAKLRALRRLWTKVEESCGLTPEPALIHAETAWRMMSRPRNTSDSSLKLVVIM